MQSVKGWIIAGVVLIALTFAVTIGALKLGGNDTPANGGNDSGACVTCPLE